MAEKEQKPLEATDPKVLAQVSPAYWAAFLYRLKLANGQTFSFEGREYLKEPLEITCVEKVSMKATGGGYPIDITTPVPTPSGWATMEDIRVRDNVFGTDGKTYTVKLVHPIKYNQKCYKVIFSDKSSIVCDGDHLWTLTDMWHYRYVKQVTIKTVDILNSRKKENRNRYVLNVAKPLNLPDAKLPVDPYILGLWLGDGNSYSAQLTCGVGDAEEYRKIFKSHDVDFEIRDRENVLGPHRNIKFNGLSVQLREIGVLKNKHIPLLYLRASYSQRLELLRGLMDTDGHITKKGKCEFYNINTTLIDNVKELVLSLGAKAVSSAKQFSMNWDHTELKDYKIYRVSFKFYDDVPVAKIKRKVENQTKRADGNTTITERRRIISVVPVDSVPVRCITVDSPDHLFLAGEDFIPVHNSECAIVRSIHGMRYRRYPQGVGYYFPTDDDMQDYVKSRFNPLIANNPEAIGKYFKTVGKSTDSASFKRIFDSNLYLRGATMKPGEDGGSRQSTKITGIQFDRAVLDEIDQMETEVIAKVRGRMANACTDGIKGFYELEFIGNPSDEDRGVDSIWQGSDKRYWFRICSCGGMTCAELEFINDPEKCVGFYPDRDERERTNQPVGYIRCVKCGKPVGIRNGKWIATVSSVKTRVGHNWSHLTSEYQDPARILRDYRNPPENNLGDVMRLDLGLAYSSQDEKLRKDNVYACCGNQGFQDHHDGPCIMGVDNDDGKHIVIGGRTGNDRYEIFKTCRVDDFKAAYDLVIRFHVKSAVVDCRPNKDSAMEFAKACRAVGCRVYLCEYTESILQDVVFNDDTGIVKVYRTGIFDASHRVFVENHILLPRRCKAIDDYALQCCNCVKSKEKNKKTGQIVFRYKKTGGGNDHYRNATNYFLVAAKKSRVVKQYGYRNESKDCIMDYSVV